MTDKLRDEAKSLAELVTTGALIDPKSSYRNLAKQFLDLLRENGELRGELELYKNTLGMWEG